MYSRWVNGIGGMAGMEVIVNVENFIQGFGVGFIGVSSAVFLMLTVRTIIKRILA